MSLKPKRPTQAAKAILAGLCIAGSVPPWGFWPLAFIGFAILDHVLRAESPKTRFKLGFLAAAAWLYPAMFWMIDMTPPGYIVIGTLMSAGFGLATAVCAPSHKRLLLPGLIALAELVRWSWPLGGVPLANIALGQAQSPIAYSARIAGALLIVVLVVVAGQALANLKADTKRSIGAIALVGIVSLSGYLHRPGVLLDEIDVALVQGGGEQNTRASASGAVQVLENHIEATQLVERNVDLVIWPENVINPRNQTQFDEYRIRVTEAAADVDAPILGGWFFPINETETVNYHSTILPNGDEIDRYDKIRIVPFGEFVPFRSLLERFSSQLPSRDVKPGTVDPILDTPVGPVGVQISWEGYFDNRARSSVNNGAQILANPTNGSSYWLTQVQTQQVAANQITAISYDRYVLQVAPTGLSAVIDPSGNLIERTDVSEQAVITQTVELKSGRTLASYVGFIPGLVYGLIAAAVGLTLTLRQSKAKKL